MRRYSICIVACLVALFGCELAPQLGPTSDDVTAEDVGLNIPGGASGQVRVRLINPTEWDAAARVTMRLASQEVHFSLRTVPAGLEGLVVGPDQADTVLVEITLLTDPVTTRPLLTYTLGKDFQNGDTIEIVISADDDDEPALQPLVVTVEGLETDLRVAVGMDVQFTVRLFGDYSGAARVDVLCDPDWEPANGDEFAIATSLAAADTIAVPWTVPALGPGWYRVYAEVQDGGDMVRSAPTLGVVHVNAAPTLELGSPQPEQLVTRGHDLHVAWSAYDLDDNATITLFVDDDTNFDELPEIAIIRDDISEDNQLDRTLEFDTATLDSGVYYIGGLIDDGLSTAVAYAGPIEITDRLVGHFSPEDLDAERITTIVGGSDNRLFGTAVDCSRSMNASEDELADLLIGDPSAGVIEHGEVYYFESPAAGWQSTYVATTATLRMIGERTDSATGRRVAFVESGGGYKGGADRDVLIGAPGFIAKTPPAEGQAYRLWGSALLELVDEEQTELELVELESWLGARLTSSLPSEAGLDVGGLGDIDGSGTSDFGVGATKAGGGVVYVFSGNDEITDGNLSDLAALEIVGTDPNSLTGHALCAIRDATGNETDEFAIGAPMGGPSEPNRPAVRPGMTYLIFGSYELFKGVSNPYYLWDLGWYEDPEGRILVGENDGDLAGWSLASGDFDGDGKPDLLIGAPGCDGGRGRVYLIYDVGASELPCAPETLDLVSVGSEHPGVVFDGLAPGDQLGYAVANAGDFDGDGIDDLLLGAPGAESQRGAAYLIYGASSRALEGATALSAIGTRALYGWELAGPPEQVSRLGESLSAGDVTGNSLSDTAIGAPGNAGNAGSVYLLFGWTATP